jgi:signal transduction histidine kinase
LSIDDDGVGFTVEHAASRLREGHFGLVGMRERIELSGGTWQLDSTPGGGTTITASLPDRSEHAVVYAPSDEARVGA